jgi:hypothetical protein
LIQNTIKCSKCAKIEILESVLGTTQQVAKKWSEGEEEIAFFPSLVQRSVTS